MVINGGWRDGKKQTKNAQIWDYIEDIQNVSKSYIQSIPLNMSADSFRQITTR